MKQQLFHIHGGSSFSEHDAFINYLKTRKIQYPYGVRPDRWSKFLQSELGDTFEVFTPQMPNLDNSKYEEWKIWFERHFEFLHDGVIIQGWSQGALFLQKYLIENDLPFDPKALILVSPPVYPFIVEEIGEDGGDFNFDNEKLPIIANKVGEIVLFHSEDDFVVPYDHSLKFKEFVPNAELVSFTDRNHFLQSEFPELVEKIKKIAGE